MSKPRVNIIDAETIRKMGGKPFMRIAEASAYYSLGVDSLKRLAKEAGAVYHVRGVVLVNIEIINAYLENFRD